MEREGAEGCAVARPIGIHDGRHVRVGGGCVVTVGKCKIEFLLKDAGTGQWHAFTGDR